MIMHISKLSRKANHTTKHTNAHAYTYKHGNTAPQQMSMANEQIEAKNKLQHMRTKVNNETKRHISTNFFVGEKSTKTPKC